MFISNHFNMCPYLFPVIPECVQKRIRRSSGVLFQVSKTFLTIIHVPNFNCLFFHWVPFLSAFPTQVSFAFQVIVQMCKMSITSYLIIFLNYMHLTSVFFSSSYLFFTFVYTHAWVVDQISTTRAIDRNAPIAYLLTSHQSCICHKCRTFKCGF